MSYQAMLSMAWRLWRQAAGNHYAFKRFGADSSLAILSWRRFGAKPAAAGFFLAPKLAECAGPIFFQRQPNYENSAECGADAN
jgi:hypothetical protein